MTAPEHSPLQLPLAALKDGHIVDLNAWTVAKCYGDYAEEYAQLIVTAVNAHAELLAAAKETIPAYGHYDDPRFRKLKAAIARAEEPSNDDNRS